jgi:outer membrane protein
MRKQLLTVILCCLCVTLVFAQEKWDLRKCVDYATANAISVKQADIQKRLADISLKQNQLSKYPNANLGSNLGYSLGRSRDPNTNVYINQNLLFRISALTLMLSSSIGIE